VERAFPQPRDEAVVSKANRVANLSSCPRSAVSEVRNLFLRAVGRKTRRAQETVYSFRLLRAGFEPFRACAIHNKVAKPRRENISQQGHKGRKDRPFEFLKSVFVAFAILL